MLEPSDDLGVVDSCGGGRGVRVGEVVERLYRDIRSLRIYEGATEVQRLLVGREVLKAAKGAQGPQVPLT